MAKKPGAAAQDFVLFDVVYEDGSQRSNRRVPAGALGGFDDPIKSATAVLSQQDREIAEKSGIAPIAIKMVRRSGKK